MKMASMKNKEKYIWYFVSVAAALLTVFMHIYKICDIPFGLNVDEAGAAYDALNIARYGVDRHLNSYPVYFTNYGDGQNALYIYFTAILIKLFGISKYVIRAGIVVASLAGAYFGFRYCSYAYQKRHADTLFLILYAILPVFTMTQRFGLESHLMLAAGIVSLFFLARAMESGKVWLYLMAGIACGVTLYTYALAYIVLPVCLVCLLLYGWRLKCYNWKRCLAFIVPLAVLAAPLILVQIVNIFDLPAFRIGPFTITKLLTYRSDEVGAEGFSLLRNIKNVLFNTLLYDNRTYNSTPLYGNMYYISIPFIFVGMVHSVKELVGSVKNKVFHYSAPMLFWLLGQLLIGVLLTGNTTPNNTRMIGIFGCLLYFLVDGLLWVYDLCRKVSVKRCFAVGMAVFYSIGFISFAHYYFTEYNEDAYPHNWLFFESYEDIGDFVEEHEGEAFLLRPTTYPFNYVYYLLEFEVNPYDFNLSANGKEMYLGHDINEYMEQTTYQYNYVVYSKDTSSQECLESMGYTKMEAGAFYYYVTPLEQYTESVGEEKVSLDQLQLDGDVIKMSGWAFDEEKGTIFSKIVLESDLGDYQSEQIPRNDVANAFGNEAYVGCGYEFMLPLDFWGLAEEIQLVGYDQTGKSYPLYEWQKEE